ncbi:MAG: guanine deaminase [Acidobacteriota bacterium]|nr:guanine deaminase [Acidobacteriota bacterium]
MTTIHLGHLAHMKDNPFETGNPPEIVTQGALAVADDGTIQNAGPAEDILNTYPKAVRCDHGDAWLIPGLVDGHIHFPQFDVTAARGEQLLDWLEGSIFPAEARFQSQEFAEGAARAFTQKLLSCGTTCALVFGSQFPGATQALFRAARSNGPRLIAGMTLMDRGAPEVLFTPADVTYRQNEKLIREVAAEPLLDYAVTPRFALSCSEALLEVCAALVKAYPDCRIQTHINENHDEIAATRATFPKQEHYLDVYARFGLVGPRTVLAHNIHPCDDQLDRMAELSCAVCHCPASNMYLGSGLFPLRSHIERNIPVLVGSDIGAGRNFCILEELAAAFQVSQLQRLRLNVARLLYLGTLAGARALHLDNRIGNFKPGKDADFVVLHPGDDPYLTRRWAACDSPEEQLFVTIMMGRETHIRQTWLQGRRVYGND